MSTQLLYRAENANLRIDLLKVGDNYTIRLTNSQGQDGEQTLDNYTRALAAYQTLCAAAELSPMMMTKPERNALVLLNEMRIMLTHYPQRTQDVIHKFANDPDVQEHRAELRALATQTTMNDSLIRSMCTQLDREMREREKVIEQQTYVENDLYGAF